MVVQLFEKLACQKVKMSSETVAENHGEPRDDNRQHGKPPSCAILQMTS